MEHYLKLGNKRKHVDTLKKLQDSGVRVKSLEGDVDIHPSGEWLWRSFEELASKRIWDTVGPQPIQTSEINAYAEFHGIPHGVLREDLYHLVSLLDGLYIAHVRKDRKKQERKEALKARRAPRRGARRSARRR